MYVVERPSQELKPTDTVYHLIGSDEDTNRFRLNIAKVALAEAKIDGSRALYGDEIDFLLHFFRSNRILAGHRSIFERLVEVSDELYSPMQEEIEQAKAAGILTNNEAESEKENRLLFHASGTGKDIIWLKPSGLSGNFYNGTFRQWDLDDEEADVRTPEVVSLMKELDLTHDNSQYELIWDEQGRPKLLSDREHLSLGVVEDGTYRPVLTVLSEDHPVRQAQAKN